MTPYKDYGAKLAEPQSNEEDNVLIDYYNTLNFSEPRNGFWVGINDKDEEGV